MKEYSLSVIVPVYNEADTIVESLSRLLKQKHIDEILVVNDASSDKTPDLLKKINDSRVKVIHHPHNQGKGAAVRTGISEVSSEYMMIQDADLEYDPQEYSLLVDPIIQDRADVVFGSRFTGGGPHRVVYFWHMMGNRFLTLLSNMFTNINLTDMETCYKLFRREVLKGITIEEDRFGFEPEITAKVARGKWRIYEVGISYYGRTYEEGKKIGWRDGVRAIYAILKYNIIKT